MDNKPAMSNEEAHDLILKIIERLPKKNIGVPISEIKRVAFERHGYTSEEVMAELSVLFHITREIRQDSEGRIHTVKRDLG